jgi:hypothetical protein
MTIKIFGVAALVFIGYTFSVNAQENRPITPGDVLREIVPQARGMDGDRGDGGDEMRDNRMHRLREACENGNDDACGRLRHMLREACEGGDDGACGRLRHIQREACENGNDDACDRLRDEDRRRDN